MSDNGPQYTAVSFDHFANEYGFTHVTSSPGYPQSNGAAERAVRTVKAMLVKNDDPYLALLTYRSTPLENGYSPAELLMGRKLRTTVPVVPTQLLPSLPEISQLREKEKQMKEKQRKNFDRHHRATDLKPLQTGASVWIPDNSSEGTVVGETNPRSYVVQTPSGTYRRNRRQLIPLPQSANDSAITGENISTSPITPLDTEAVPAPKQMNADSAAVRTKSGRISKPPDRL